MISSSLPRFRGEYLDKADDDYAPRRGGKWTGGNGMMIRTFLGSVLRRRRLRLLMMLVVVLIGYLLFWNSQWLLPHLCLHGDGV